MVRVVCLMNIEADCATFTWSEGPASFERYSLDGIIYKGFKNAATKARDKLADLVEDYLSKEENVPNSAFELASAGFELYNAIFKPDKSQSRQAKQVRSWLEQLAQQQQVDTLEIVVESPWSLPWNIVYDQTPDKDAFLANDDSPDRWKPFWGLRYNLSGGRKVDPMRRMPLLSNPSVLLVVDAEIREGLPSEQKKRLADFVAKHSLSVVSDCNALKKAITAKRPDVLYWLSHANADELVLAGEPISPQALSELLDQDDEKFGGLAFLNACQTAEDGESGSFFEALYNVGFAGMIGTEHQTVDQFANPLGIDFLEAFLERGEPVGTILRQLRGRVPLGLLYGTYCPPDIRVKTNDSQDNLTIRQEVVKGVALSAEPPLRVTHKEPAPPLPDDPYRSLGRYDRADRALFAGREDDVERFAMMLDSAATRILILHGESGVGKSSFLSAGVIPFLEEECLGYRFLRNAKSEELDGSAGAVIFVRATSDLFSQIAKAICHYCANSYQYENPLGEKVTADLPGVLREFAGGNPDPFNVRRLLRSDLGALGNLLASIGNCLPFTTILVIDQGEEVFTLANDRAEQKRGRDALDMLRRMIATTGEFKVIFALRTEYYGRVVDRLRRGLHNSMGIREYLLTDFDEPSLVEAIRRPTITEPIPHTSEIPFEKYRFQFEDGVAEEIAKRVTNYTLQGRDSVLPLMQVICSQLYQMVNQRSDRTIHLIDLEDIGGIEGGMRKHVNSLLSAILKSYPTDNVPVQRLFTKLYLKQPDGSLTTALLPEVDVCSRWTGNMPFDTLLEKCCRTRLLKVNTLSIGSEDDRRYVSLGHDSLAKLAAEWQEELIRSERLRKKLLQIMTWAFGALGVAGLMGGVALLMNRASERALAKKSIESVELAPAVAVPYAIENLKPRSAFCLKELPARIGDDALPLQQRLHAALAMAELLPPNKLDESKADFLVSCIPRTDALEIANLVSAMKRHSNVTTNKLLSSLQNEKDPILKGRWATTLLSLESKEPEATTLFNSKNDPAARTRYIKNFGKWPGMVRVLCGLLKTSEGSDDADFRSGLCAALGNIEKDSLSSVDSLLLADTMSELFENAPDGATHSAAYWALCQLVDNRPEPKVTKAVSSGWFVNQIGATMIRIPAGKFLMGSTEATNEQPIHQETVHSFYLCDREVTLQQYTQYCSAMGLDKPDVNSDRASPEMPMERVSWTNAVLFCNWLSQFEKLKPCYEQKDGEWRFTRSANGYRLPTEVEWEYACRAGTTTRFYCGNDESDLDDYAVFNRSDPKLCGSLMPNPWGLFDMHGNVYEWCWDPFAPYVSPTESETEGSTVNLDRVYRGGSYLSVTASEIRSAVREFYGDKWNQEQFGFRIAKNAE